MSLPCSSSGVGETSARTVQDGDRVTIHYVGRLEDGTVFDSTRSRQPVTFAVGKGQVIKGLDNAVRRMHVGDKAEATFPPALAYGDREESKVITLPASNSIADVTEGDTVTLQNSQGQNVPAIILKMNDDGSSTCDTNHSLAGKTLTFDVEFMGFQEPLAPAEAPAGLEMATFAAGSFWSVELAFQRVVGVESTYTGFAQGRAPRPTYKDVGTGKTGHVMAVRVIFDPAKVTYEALCNIFWGHLGFNATTLNLMGEDSGNMFRSGIFYHSEDQKYQADKSALVKQMECKGREVITEVQAASPFFWLAEDEHQQYLSKRGQSAEKGCTTEIKAYG